MPGLPFESKPVASKAAVAALVLTPLVFMAAGVWFSLVYISSHRAPAVALIVFVGLGTAGLMLTIIAFRRGCVLRETGIERPDGPMIRWTDVTEYSLLAPGILGLTVQRRVNVLGTDGEVATVPFRRQDLAVIRAILLDKVGPERESRTMSLAKEPR